MMNHLDKELERIKKKISEMWDLVDFQVRSGQEVLMTGDKVLAQKILKRGKKVNEYDVKIDQMCENFLALFNPLAVDLRLILAILKINSNLERMGDTAEGIASTIMDVEGPFDANLLEVTRIHEMYTGAIQMMSEMKTSFLEENTVLAKQVMRMDKTLNKIHRNTDLVTVSYIQKNPANIYQSLKVAGIIRKLERIGDHTTNIAEELVFYVDAKVLKHKAKAWKDKSGKNEQNEQE